MQIGTLDDKALAHIKRKLTPEEIKAAETEAATAASENRMPFEDQREPRLSSVEPVPGIFTAADLTTENAPAASEFRIGRKKVWVHPISPEDAKLMFQWALGLRNEGDPERDPVAAQVRANIEQIDLWVYQVIICCRQGPLRSDPRCFDRADAPALRRYLGYGTLKSIVTLCDNLGGDQEALGAAARHFFGVVQSALASCSGRLNTSDPSLTGLLESLTRLQSLVGRSLKRGALDSGMLFELDDLTF